MMDAMFNHSNLARRIAECANGSGISPSAHQQAAPRLYYKKWIPDWQHGGDPTSKKSLFPIDCKNRH